MSFKNCCLLRRIDLSHNTLGPKAFEVMTRVYAKQEAIDLVLPTDVEQVQSKQGTMSTDTLGLGRRTGKLSVVSGPNEWVSDEDSDLKSDARKGSRHGLSAVSWFADLIDSVFRFKIPQQGSSPSFPTRISTPVHYHSRTQICTIYCAV